MAKTPAVEFLAESEDIRSNTSVCLTFVDPAVANLDDDGQQAFVKIVTARWKPKACLRHRAYRDAPPGLRIWGGATVDTSDLEALFRWLDWAYASERCAKAALRPYPPLRGGSMRRSGWGVIQVIPDAKNRAPHPGPAVRPSPNGRGG